MLIYHAHPDTGIYSHSSIASPDPLELQLERDALVSSATATASDAFAMASAGLDDDEEGLAELNRLRALLAQAIAAAEAEAAAIAPTKFLVPAYAYEDAPPAFGFDEVAVRRDGAWVVEAIPEPIEEVPSHDELAVSARARRNGQINQVGWLIARHRDEIDLARPTTLTAPTYLALLTYVQDLREVPEQAGFPTDISWPSLPAGIESVEG